MYNKIGSPVRSEDFLERAATQELWHLAERGHVLMLAPRRVGKTSLLCHMQDVPRDGWKRLFFSVESLDSESQFVARLLEKLSEAHPDGAWMERFGISVRKFLKGVGQTKAGFVDLDLSEALKDEWRDIGSIALKVLQELECDTLVLIDEFPIFVRNLLGDSDEPEAKRRTKLFLDWFRSVRNASIQSKSRVHFVLTGSLGLDHVVKAVNLSGTINDLVSFKLGPLEPGEARELLRRLSKGEGLPLSESVQDRILERIDSPVPYYLQLLFREMLTRTKFHQATVDERLVDDAYESLLSAEKMMYFSHWKERLDDDPFLRPQERDLRHAFLQAAARDREGLSPGTIVQIRVAVASDIDAQAVLLALSYDGYLTRDGDRWRFTSTLLRDWWRRWQVKERP